MNKENKELLLEAGYAVVGATAAATTIVQLVTIVGFIALKLIDKDL